MSLTSKQEAFVQAIADGMTQADAYRTAFDAEKMKPETIHKRASELIGKGEVAGRLAELRGALSTKALWTREMSVKALVQAFREGRPSEKVAAVKELNAMHGYNAPDRLDLTNSDGSLAPKIIKIVGKK